MQTRAHRGAGDPAVSQPSTNSVLPAPGRVRPDRIGQDRRFREFRREQVEQSIVSLFEQQVAQHPDRIAVQTRHEALTYQALDAAANRLAHAIAADGRPAGDQQPIALLFGQTRGAVTATLGVLKSCRPYVPLAPSDPHDRLVEILNDARATLLITDTRHLPLVSGLAGRWPVLNIDELDPDVAAGVPPAPAPATALAAIFYTSGTTGKPKGVMQDHRSILHRVLIDTNSHRICPDDRLSLLSPPTYSVSLRNLFGALLNGATVCPFDLDEYGFGRLSRWLLEDRITILSATPTVFRHLAATLTGDEPFSDLRLIDIGGEGALTSDVELYRRYFPPSCLLANTLGCNEAGVFRRYFIDTHTRLDGSVVPVGYEVPDKEVVLLADGKQVTTNQLGEIAIRSRYLPRGYWGRPDLTDAAFVPDPRGGDQHLYLTGDLGEMRPDGCLIYRGRKDSRAKIRGQFVDLSELENRLLQPGHVQEAVVKAVERRGNRTQLVAFVVPSRDSAVTTRQLRRFLARTLPAFMVPSKFVFLNGLPRFPNGKVDHQRLVLPEEVGNSVREIERTDGPAYVAPIETIEHQLVEIWEELLRVHPIGVADNFFDLGGDSLMALEMIEEVEWRCGEPVPVSAFLGGATLGELAQTLVEQRIHGRDSLVARVQGGHASSWPFFFLHGDFRGGGFYCLNLARGLGNDQRFYAVTAHGLNGDQVPPTIEAMAASYVEMIQAIEPRGPYLLGGLCHAGLIAFEMARQLERKGHEVALVAMIGPPAWNPPHWRWSKDAIAAVVRLCGGSPDRATDMFLALRGGRMRLRQFGEYAISWLQATANMSMADRRAATARLAKRLLSGVLVSEKPWAAEPVQPPATDELLITYRRAVTSYVRRPYSGRVALFWPQEVPINTLGGIPLQWTSAPDPGLGWRTVAPDLEIHRLPGDYTTSITKHVQVLANLIKASVKHARSRYGSDPSERTAAASTSHEPLKTDGPRSRCRTYPVP